MPGHNLGMRRLALLLAAFLVAGASARAATVPPLPDADRTNTYTVSAATSTFAVPFAVYGDCSDLDVFENGTFLSPLTYTCGSASGQTQRPVTDDVITLSSPLMSGTLQIVGHYRPRNLVMATAPGITRYEFNRTVNTLLAALREVRTKAEQATTPQLYGFWDPGTYYPTNAVVGFGQQEWQAAQGNVNQTPQTGSPYWTAVVSPPQQVTFVSPTLPGLPAFVLAAPTVDIGLVPTHFLTITGSGTISSFGSSCSASTPVYYVSFTGANTLVNNVNLAVPGGANITTGGGDVAVVQCLGGGASRVIVYTPYAQTPGFTFPSGAVMAFNLASCPRGWITADGTNGTADTRGNAIRGLDLGAGRDPGRALATLQGDQLQAFSVTTTVSADPNTHFAVPNSGGSQSPQYNPSTVTGNIASTAGGALRTGAETRMENVALLYCQKS